MLATWVSLHTCTFCSFQNTLMSSSYVLIVKSCVSLLLIFVCGFHFSDIVLYLCENEHIEGGMIFQLLEDLTEMSTMKNCKDIFAYIESKQDILGKVYFSVVSSSLCCSN